jgi:hypothetical protein
MGASYRIFVGLGVVALAGFMTAAAVGLGSQRRVPYDQGQGAAVRQLAPVATRLRVARIVNRTRDATQLMHAETVSTRPEMRALSRALLTHSSGDGIDLFAPGNGTAWTWSAGGYLAFSWYEAWYCTGCDGVEVLLVWDSNGNKVAELDGVCPASSSPSCPTQAQISLPPGSYTWGVGIQLGSNPTHVSDIWRFDITGSAPAPPATTTAVPPPPTAPTTTTTAPPPPTAPVAPPASVTTAAPPVATAVVRCRVPKLRGMTVAAAQLKLFNANCSLGSVTRIRSSSVRRGRVISSSPSAGKSLPADARVRVAVSRGR